MSSPVNETLIRDVVAEVLSRLGQHGRPAAAGPSGPGASSGGTAGAPRTGSGRRMGVFQNAAEACEAAHEADLQLSEKRVGGRVRIIEILKGLCESNANEWGRIELEETRIGRLDHKIEKLK